MRNSRRAATPGRIASPFAVARIPAGTSSRPIDRARPRILPARAQVRGMKHVATNPQRPRPSRPGGTFSSSRPAPSAPSAPRPRSGRSSARWTPTPPPSRLARRSISTSTPVAEGQIVKLFWRGKLIFVRHRTPEEIKEAEDVNVASLPDPQADSARVKPGKAQWLIVYGNCTHLGCVPLGHEGASTAGSAPATARCSTRRAASARARADQPAGSALHSSLPTPRSRSAEPALAVHSAGRWVYARDSSVAG